uniref:Uncharacterized protein n=1 Tax=Nicotiana tabacum TaxID=4097 RepID=A0A1S3XW62_TOBAC|nr:PREDICTED: uncharacterized protein LOC107769415 [Nicotiana tabacum]
MFKERIGKIGEVCTNDTLVKSLCAEDNSVHLQEIFAILRKYNTRLSPEKCAFGVGSGKSLGSMASNRGNKIEAIEGITIVDSVEAMRRLTGQIATSGRLTSRSWGRSHQFFSLLEKKKDFTMSANLRTIKATSAELAFASHPEDRRKARSSAC